ncbi:DUF3486 family protein [Ruminococcaceae bacterium OttesenSCG-928-A11]|nr:DUF3486 family protein [Ruminococcaceae bacterium OttesenSCG-928-A11]
MAGMTERRRNGIIDKLPALLRETVDQMLLGGIPYREIVEYLEGEGVTLSRQAVCNYARKFLATTQMMRIAENNFRVLTEAIDRAPELDTAEGLIRVASNHTLNALTQLTPEDLAKLDPAKLMRETSALIKATSHKRRVDIQNSTEQELGLDAIKNIAFDALKESYPDVFRQLSTALKELKAEDIKKPR